MKSQADESFGSVSFAMRRFLLSMLRSGLVSVLLALTGCIYGFSGGGLPSHVHTVAIIPFANLTTNSEIQRELADSLRSKLHDRLGLRDAAEAKADAIVRGTIQRYETDIPISYSATNKQTPSARRQLQVTVDVEMVDQVTGKTLWQRKGLTAEGQYEERGEAVGRRQALDRIIDDIIQGAQSQW
jgi:Lipopolysaccharide-assembly